MLPANGESTRADRLGAMVTSARLCTNLARLVVVQGCSPARHTRAHVT